MKSSLMRSVLAVAFLATIASSAEARDARCRIFQDGRLALDRLCDFQPEGRNGSFILSARGGNGSLLPGISNVSVSVFRPDTAEVRGLTRDGINSRWGEARRSPSDRACWAGSDFRICVY
ncbi:MAG: hypothetical protein AB7F96_02010 [Beijerinckiaceae bacterium]